MTPPENGFVQGGSEEELCGENFLVEGFVEATEGAAALFEEFPRVGGSCQLRPHQVVQQLKSQPLIVRHHAAVEH